MTLTPPNPQDDDTLLLDAYVDGELDASEALRIERRLETDAAFKSDFDRLTALRRAVRSNVSRDLASDALRQRIEALARPNVATVQPRAQSLRTRTFDWRQLAASVAIAGAVASSGTVLALRQGGSSGTDVASIVAEHRRALLAASPVDVEKSDRHTVKPWFDAKLALSPQVVDLAQDGFPLAGGRIEVVGGKLVPAMIYRRRGHLISLVAVPRQGGHDDGGSFSSTTEDGYSVVGWHGQDFDYYAVSDVAPEDLSAFLASWRKSTK